MALDDTTLLERWTTHQDVEAFDEIVGRFANPVYGTCRRILRNDADAEEITQECFLLLVRSGGEIRSSLGGWLHRVATTKSLDRIRREIHRRERERVFEEAAKVDVEMAWDDIQEHVDAAIDTLPDETRDVIVAHFLQRKTHEEIAAERAVTRRAISYRIQRGLESIRRELRKRGVAVSVASLGTSLAADADAVAAPLSLKATLGKLAIAAGSAPAGSGATAGGSLLGSLILMKTKTLATGVLVLVAAGIFFALTRAPRETPAPPVGAGESEIVALADEPAIETTPQPEAASVDNNEPVVENEEAPTLEDLLALSHTELERALENYPPIEDPEQYASVSGVVLDKDGYAIPGAAIALVPTQYWGRLPGAGEMARTASSGPDGSYHIEDIASSGFFWVSAAKAGFATSAHGASKDGPLKVEGGMNATVNFTLDGGPTLRGRVLTAAGAPVPDALVQCIGIAGPHSGGFDESRGGRTGPEGNFTLGFSEEERGFVTSVRVQSAKHGATTFPEVLIQDEHSVELKLTAPAIIQGTITNSDGKAVAGARMNFYAKKDIEVTGVDGQDWNHTIHGGHFVGRSDSKGRFATELDAGLDFEVEIRVAGYQIGGKRDEIAALAAGEIREYNPVLEANVITVRAEIVGRQSGESVRSYLPIDAIAMRDGERVGYSLPGSPDAIHFALPPEPGEYTFQARYIYNSDLSGDLSKPYQLDAGDDIEIELNVPDPQTFTVRAVDPGGSPVAGAWVHFISESWGDSHTPYQTNSDGRLEAPIVIAPEIGAHFYLTGLGYATAWGSTYEDQSPGTVHPEETFVLWPDAGFEGDLVGQDGQPLAATPLTITVTNLTGQAWPLETTTDANGHFTVVDGAPADVVDITITSADGSDAWMTGEVRLRANAITGLGELSVE